MCPGGYGFLAYEQDDGKKLFFHMSEVEGGEVLQVGQSNQACRDFFSKVA